MVVFHSELGGTICGFRAKINLRNVGSLLVDSLLWHYNQYANIDYSRTSRMSVTENGDEWRAIGEA